MTAAAVRTHLVEVEFKGNRRAFFTFEGDAPPPARAAVIVQVERGEDLGRVHATGELAEKRKAGTTHGKAAPADLPRVVRLASKKEVDTAVRLRADEDAVRRAALEFVRELKLDMKVSDAEWQWDRRRLTCYFTAEERVDFRELVKDLASVFKTRIELRQIAGGFRFSTRAEHSEYIRRFRKQQPSAKLSIAALETLAVIAYKQPVTIPEILEIRGVTSSSAIKTLLDKRLIVAKGRKKVVGRPMMYGTSKEFLVQFGINDLSELPNLEDFEDVVTS